LLTVAHQVMSLELDKRVLAFQRSETVFAVLLNNPAVWGDIVAYILFLLGFYMIEYRRTNRGYELEYSRLETELARTRLHELRGRVHPDFLLDTLDALRALLRSKQNKKANAALSQLSEFLRTTVYDHDRDEATLREEVVLMNRYIELEKLRMAGVISATEEIIGDAGNAVVASFLLQPIVEELIRSNLGGRAARCDIELRAETRDEMLEVVIKVRKDEVSREARMLSGGGALAMTKERLAHLYGEHQEFSIGLATGGREFVSLKIPFNVKRMKGELAVEEPI
jgi:two-component system LytT family sensor kinase